jgi:tetratricopeptide (TPR) repeat protein
VAVFKETARFYSEHPPYELIFDPSLQQEGETDYAKRTATLLMRVGLVPSEAGFAALTALLVGLEQTGRRGTWGFGGWPLGDLNPKVSGTTLFGGKNDTGFAVEVLLLNDRQKPVGMGSSTLRAAPGMSAGNKSVTLPPERFDHIRFQNVKADELSPVLTIVINSVNGIPSKSLNSRGYMRIAPGDVGAAKVYESRGDAYYEKKDYNRAIAEYTEAIKLDPSNAFYFNIRGDAYYLKEDYDRAIADYTEAIRLEPDNAFYFNIRGDAYYQKNDYDRAIADYTEAIKLEPDNAWYFNKRGNAYYHGKDNYAQALSDYTKAHQLAPHEGLFYNSMGNAYYSMRDYTSVLS